MRSLATRQANLALSKYVQESIDICKSADFDMIIVETSGIGQSDTEITEHCDVSLYVMTSEYGAASQLEKIDMLDFADLVAINKFDKKGSLDAIRDVRKQYKRNHNLLYKAVMDKIVSKTKAPLESTAQLTTEQSKKIFVIPPERVRYLAEIVENNKRYDEWAKKQSDVAQKLYQLKGTLEILSKEK